MLYLYCEIKTTNAICMHNFVHNLLQIKILGSAGFHIKMKTAVTIKTFTHISLMPSYNSKHIVITNFIAFLLITIITGKTSHFTKLLI